MNVVRGVETQSDAMCSCRRHFEQVLPNEKPVRSADASVEVADVNFALQDTILLDNLVARGSLLKKLDGLYARIAVSQKQLVMREGSVNGEQLGQLASRRDRVKLDKLMWKLNRLDRLVRTAGLCLSPCVYMQSLGGHELNC